MEIFWLILKNLIKEIIYSYTNYLLLVRKWKNKIITGIQYQAENIC